MLYTVVYAPFVTGPVFLKFQIILDTVYNIYLLHSMKLLLIGHMKSQYNNILYCSGDEESKTKSNTASSFYHTVNPLKEKYMYHS